MHESITMLRQIVRTIETQLEGKILHWAIVMIKSLFAFFSPGEFCRQVSPRCEGGAVWSCSEDTPLSGLLDWPPCDSWWRWWSRPSAEPPAAGGKPHLKDILCILHFKKANTEWPTFSKFLCSVYQRSWRLWLRCWIKWSQITGLNFPKSNPTLTDAWPASRTVSAQSSCSSHRPTSISHNIWLPKTINIRLETEPDWLYFCYMKLCFGLNMFIQEKKTKSSPVRGLNTFSLVWTNTFHFPSHRSSSSSCVWWTSLIQVRVRPSRSWRMLLVWR